MPPDRITISKRGRDQLISLKKHTGIDQWNVVCRWALCVSLRKANKAPETLEATDSNVEMSWTTFAGDLGDVYWAAMKQRCHQDGLDAANEELVTHQFKLHLHRGISYLSDRGKIHSITDLLELTKSSKV